MAAPARAALTRRVDRAEELRRADPALLAEDQARQRRVGDEGGHRAGLRQRDVDHLAVVVAHAADAAEAAVQVDHVQRVGGGDGLLDHARAGGHDGAGVRRVGRAGIRLQQLAARRAVQRRQEQAVAVHLHVGDVVADVGHLLPRRGGLARGRERRDPEGLRGARAVVDDQHDLVGAGRRIQHRGIDRIDRRRAGDADADQRDVARRVGAHHVQVRAAVQVLVRLLRARAQQRVAVVEEGLAVRQPARAALFGAIDRLGAVLARGHVEDVDHAGLGAARRDGVGQAARRRADGS